VARIGGRDSYRVLVGKPAGKKPLGIPRHRWEDNIKMNLQEFGWGGQIELVWLTKEIGSRVCECGNEHSVSKKCGKFLD
jgi:hypothetical protein